MSTLLDIVTGALTSLGQLGLGQTASPEDGANGQRHMNLLMGRFSAERLLIPYVATRSYALVANTADYTIGPTGATFTEARPTFIESAQVFVPGSSYLTSMNILDKPKWDAIHNRSAMAEVPESVYVEYLPLSLAFHVHPKPIAAPLMQLGAWLQLQKFSTLFDAFALPEEYEEFLESSLALVWAPDFDQPIPQSLIDRQGKAQQAVMSKNAQGMGGAITSAQMLQSPNVGQPIPSGQAAPAGQ